MSQQAIVKTFDIGDGRMISIETGKLAKQADGSVVVRMGNTMLLATVCAKKEVGEKGQVFVGGAEAYIPLCRKHYLMMY
jgi:polyribonucleotide nucleotidyltransferase